MARAGLAGAVFALCAVAAWAGHAPRDEAEAPAPAPAPPRLGLVHGNRINQKRTTAYGFGQQYGYGLSPYQAQQKTMPVYQPQAGTYYAYYDYDDYDDPFFQESAFDDEDDVFAGSSGTQSSAPAGSSSTSTYSALVTVIPVFVCIMILLFRHSRRPTTAMVARPAAQLAQANSGSGSVAGLSAQSIRGLTSFSFKTDGKYHATECPVCCDAFAEGDMIRELPGCKHRFHMECIDEWLSIHPTCPICRADTREALREEINSGADDNDNNGDDGDEEPNEERVGDPPPGYPGTVNNTAPTAPVWSGARGVETDNNVQDVRVPVAESSSPDLPAEEQEGGGARPREAASGGAQDARAPSSTTAPRGMSLASAAVLRIRSSWWLMRTRWRRQNRRSNQEEVLAALSSSRRERASSFLRRQAFMNESGGSRGGASAT